jgi:small subunit ribosomal protein S9
MVKKIVKTKEAVKQFSGTGRRKTSVARVWMKNGQGEITVNKKPLREHFIRETLINIVMAPLTLTKSTDKFDIKINVRGGGVSGQAGAVRHGIARALIVASPEERDVLKKQGLLTRDPRMKERKKYGQPGARKKFQFSKR